MLEDVKKPQDTLELKFAGYLIRGIVEVTLWMGDQGTLEMAPFYLEELTEEGIKAEINDGGFGVMSIDRAEGSVTALYNQDGIPTSESDQYYKVFLGRWHTEDIPVTAQRGI